VLIQPALGVCALFGLVGIWTVARWYLRRARPAYLEQAAAWAELADEIAAGATGARTVDALGLRDRRIAAGERAIGRCRRVMLRTLVLRNVLWGCVETSYALPVAASLLLGGLLHAHGAAGLGGVVSCALYFNQLTGPLDTILMWSDQMQSGSAAFARVEGLADAPVRTSGDERPGGDLIEVTGVRYGYDEGGEVLHGVDLTVRPGERLALVGPSGAGKSTLSRLLAGIEPPGSGTVTVGGVPVAGLDPQVLRRQVVLVTQEHHVFLGTLRDNLAIAAPGADDDALRAALETVGAGWAAELPHGLDTVLGSGGHRTDGSQAQQIALARVVLADPHTVVLDEATAMLDPATARHTERALAAVLAERTVIAVAHRLHTAHDADRVAVMVDGRIAELGSHDELLDSGGAYAALWDSWHGRTTAGRSPDPVPAPPAGDSA
jgi:ATP-binding cassette, subfamily C, bacterial